MREPKILRLSLLLVLALPAAASAQESFGVDVCDTFLKNYEACLVTKIPVPVQPQARNALNELRLAWRAIASDPATKARFPAVCNESAELVKMQTAAIGCQW